MSLISFSTPSDEDILRKLSKNKEKISFIGEGSIKQKVNETLYVRTVKIKRKKVELLQNVIFVKKGISWFFKSIENASSA